MCAVKVYTSSVNGRTEVKKRVQRVLFVLQSKRIEHEVIDLAQSHNNELDFLKTHCKDDPNRPVGTAPGLPQIFVDEACCGGYEDFEQAIENEELYSFLKLKRKSEEKESVALNGHTENGELGDEKKMEDRDESANENQAEEATEADADAAWERRQRAKKQKLLAAAQGGSEGANEPEIAAAGEQSESDQKTKSDEKIEPDQVTVIPSTEETSALDSQDADDAAWQRRMKKRKQQQQQREEEEEKEKEQKEKQVSEESDQKENAEPNSGQTATEEDEDAAWRRRMKRKQQNLEKEGKQEEEEVVDDVDVVEEEN